MRTLMVALAALLTVSSVCAEPKTIGKITDILREAFGILATHAGCAMNGKRYKRGERFYSNCDRCECTYSGLTCVPGCPVQGVAICSPFEKSVIVEEPMRHGPEGCFCYFEECQAIPDAGCTLNGKTYKIGEDFSDGCSQCQCHGKNRTSCFPVCPPVAAVQCGPDEKEVIKMEVIDAECSCPLKYCVKRGEPTKIVDGHRPAPLKMVLPAPPVKEIMQEKPKGSLPKQFTGVARPRPKPVGEPFQFPEEIPPPMVNIVTKGTCKHPFSKNACESYAKQENLGNLGSLKSTSYGKFPAGCYLKYKEGKVIKALYNEGTKKSPACGTGGRHCVCHNF